jgi:hypothetical protein
MDPIRKRWDGKRSVPDPLEWKPPPPVFTEPVLNKEPTLLQARTKLEPAFTTDNRCFFE